jgi:hypothetical protein
LRADLARVLKHDIEKGTLLKITDFKSQKIIPVLMKGLLKVGGNPGRSKGQKLFPSLLVSSRFHIASGKHGPWSPDLPLPSLPTTKLKGWSSVCLKIHYCIICEERQFNKLKPHANKDY